MSKETAYCLGIDIGTTSLKVSLVDQDGKEICCTSENFGADIESDIGELGFEQCPMTIIKVLDNALVPILTNYKGHISGIGITGQMHGLVLWKRHKSKTIDETSDQRMTLLHHLDANYKTSHLYTWQDQRCTPSFLASLPAVSDPHQPIATGHGCATLFWLLRHRNSELEEANYDRCGTIMDFLTALICELDHPVTSDQLAASLGYFQYENRQWDPVLKTSGFPLGMLPTIVEAGTCIGRVSASHSGWPSDVPVYVGMGDVQCAMYSLMKSPTTAIVNIGTSIQLGFLSKSSDVPELQRGSAASISFFPFFQPFHLTLCAGLNGGNAVKHFVVSLSNWMADLGCERPANVDNLFSKLQKLAEEDADRSKGDNNTTPPQLSVRPSFFGERHDPEMGGSMSGISLTNFQSVGHVFRRLCEGIIDHMSSMVPPGYLLSRGLNKLLVCGSVPKKNGLVRNAIRQMYGVNGLEVEIAHSDEQEMNSAKGAGQIVRDLQLRS